MQITCQENNRSINGSGFRLKSHNSTIAPVFYYSQVDLAGPFRAYTFHSKRIMIKIQSCIFCCSTTLAVSIKVIEDFSSASFIQYFTQLSCEVGYPKQLLPDEGSQIITGYSSTKIDFQNTKLQLHHQMDVNGKHQLLKFQTQSTIFHQLLETSLVILKILA